MTGSLCFQENAFAWLAFTEAISFEEFELGSALAALAERALRDGVIGSFEYALAAGNKRLIVMSEDCAKAPAAGCSDLVCIQCLSNSEGRSWRHTALLSGALAVHARVCLVHNGAGGAVRYPLRAFAGGRVEWQAGVAGARSSGGLFFSDGWRPDIAQHVQRALARFESTRPYPVARKAIKACISI